MNTNAISRLFGKFASHSFPRWFQRIINRVYVRIFAIDLSDFAPAESYPTLNALFTRKLAHQRKVDSSKDSLISPSDSLITEQGIVASNLALQIKGMSYPIDGFLGIQAGEADGFSYINLYLSPSDYHRYHAPCDMEIIEARYFGGELLPVNFPSLRKNSNLFVRNERVVLVANTPHNTRIYFVAVGALNVGKMIFHFDSRINTNATPNARDIYTYDTPICVKKGDDLGHFQMGSTIVLVMQDSSLESSIDQKVRFGERIAHFGV